MNIPYYLKIGHASDIQNPKERKLFRFLEILPGVISWLTLILVFLLSWLNPFLTAIFVICFVVYWLVRAVYFSFHLNASYKRMRKNEKRDWLKDLRALPKSDRPAWEDIYHLIILPMSKEPLEIIREAFKSLAESDYPKEKMIVVLSCEERTGEGPRKTAEIIEKEFQGQFFRLLLVFHPDKLPGEIVGKGANETWGARKAKELIVDPLKIPYENVIVSSFDADIYVFPKYFGCLTYSYLTCEHPLRSSFQPIPLFINNIWQTPPISRIFSFSATFWQMMCQERPEKLITFSSHSMPFRALVDVDFRQTNIVSDDSRIFWQCFLRYDGDYRVVPLFYPVSMDANAAPTFTETMKNVYRQQRRWAYGVGEIPYYLFGFLKNKKIPLMKKLSLGTMVFEGHWSWATNSIILFLLGWLPVVLGGQAFNQTLLSYNLPILTSRVLTLGMIGLIGSIYFNIKLLPHRPPGFGRKKYFFFGLEWLLMPLIMIFFTSLPALDAQTRWILGRYMSFWFTPKTRKKI